MAREAVLYQRGKVAGVIDMRVRQKHCRDRSGRNRQMAVQAIGFLAAALRQTTIQQILPAIHFQVMH